MKVLLPFFIVLSVFNIPDSHAQFTTTYDMEIENLANRTVQKIKTKKLKTVAVWFFHNTKGKKTELGDYIGRDFSIYFTDASNGYNVIDRDHIEQISGEHEWNDNGFIDSNTAKNVGKILAADAIVTGTVDVGLHSLRIRIKVINTTTGVQVAAHIGNISIDENIKAILENTNFDKPIRKTRRRVSTSETENDRRTTNKKCQTLGTGDYCFSNLSKNTYGISIYGNRNNFRRNASVYGGGNVCFFDLPEGTYQFELFKNNLRTTLGPQAGGSFRVEKCQSLTYSIQENSQSNKVGQQKRNNATKSHLNKIIEIVEPLLKKKN